MMFATLAAVLTLTAGPGQDAPQDPPSSQLGDVVVEGSRTLQEAVRAFTAEVVEPPVGRGPSRWERRVCVGVANMQRDAAQIIIDRVSAIALDAGLEVEEPGCDANILVVASDDGRATARALVEIAPLAFRPGYAGASRSRRQLQLFQDREAPVRWWHVSVMIDSDTGALAMRLPGELPPRIRQDQSRLTTRIRNDLRRAFVVVDVSQMENVSLQQLGDYVGMVAMAQIDPDADTSSFDTILNLFDGGVPAPGITPWDVSYLRSLYDAELNARQPVHQTGRVANLMIRDQEAPPEEKAD